MVVAARPGEVESLFEEIIERVSGGEEVDCRPTMTVPPFWAYERTLSRTWAFLRVGWWIRGSRGLRLGTGRVLVGRA